jgi:hypothetical protein
MNIDYAKTALYAYPRLNEKINYLDRRINRKAFGSRLDYRPALDIYNDVTKLVFERNIYTAIKELVEVTLNRFDDNERRYFVSRYFGNKPSAFEYFDPSVLRFHRFKRRPRLDEEFAELLELTGLNDGWFESSGFKVGYIKHCLKKVIERKNEDSE